MNWIEYHSIKELPETIWAKVAGDNPCLSADFMEIVENLPQKIHIIMLFYTTTKKWWELFFTLFSMRFHLH